MWSNLAAARARCLVVCRVLETRSLLRHIAAAVPGAQITVIRLQAPLSLLHARVRAREAGDPGWYPEAAAYLAGKLETADVEDHTVDGNCAAAQGTRT
jgi:predicted kinase